MMEMGVHFSQIVLCAALLFSLSALLRGENIEDEEDGSVRIVQIESGMISGRRNFTLFEQMPFYAFKGIPYAQPPIDQLRFRVCSKSVHYLSLFNSKLLILRFRGDRIHGMTHSRHLSSAVRAFKNVPVPNTLSAAKTAYF